MPVYLDDDAVDGDDRTVSRSGNVKPVMLNSGREAAAAADSTASRRASRVDPMAVAANVAMRLDRDSASAASTKRGSAAVKTGGGGSARMSRAEKASMDAEIDDALHALDNNSRSDEQGPQPEPSGSGGGLVLPILPAVARRSDAQGAPVSGRKNDSFEAPLPQLPAAP
jgi:hypothetical protein